VQVVGPSGEGFLNLLESTPPPPPEDCELGLLFRHNPNEYNHNLATFAAELSAFAYLPTADFFDEYNNLGLRLVRRFNYGVDDINLLNAQRVAHSIAHKEVISNGERRNLIVVSIRGTVDNAEWVSNFLGQQWDFYAATLDVARNFDNYVNVYVNENGLRSNDIVLVTGHSRGGAVANRLGASLPNAYVYTFASPNSLLPLTAPVTPSRNVSNILNRNDAVTWVPPGSRHGRDYHILMTDIRGGFGHAHYMETYLAWMQGKYLTYGELESYAKVFGRSPRIITVNSPVDITIYDSRGRLVGEIRDNTAIDVENSEVITWVTEGGAKQAFLPYGETYTVEFRATGDGTMTYTVETANALPGTPDLVKAFENIRLYTGRQMLSEIVETPDVRLLFLENGNTAGEITKDGTEIRFQPPHPCDCLNCVDCGFFGGRFGFGRVTNSGTLPDISDALAILRYLVSLPNAISVCDDARAAAIITAAGSGSSPGIADALAILRFLVNLPSPVLDEAWR